ncbi:site-specific integrase [Vibrio parahaemolyticus]|uniref:site-specific integrase n=1 Tax=Vibrio parahaemolyticus TaxID=670 RepID=UPI00215CBF5E|nr:site-specific integrase [Vibrio parahaemolyticus]MCR9645010.1 site-specific integrase [Vibrio parahaemolyticus]MCR9801380.1 site-specific integrase [Vibrio parahaemolyticus]MDF4314263.1 site-specific integrase [Vibrio parahaemolyticus]MDT8847204.1 site-specific integrase [Vibrio parahaemolyticus]MDT8919564.1 site-specific integrase [Vibrio parahaemolyticus]
MYTQKLPIFPSQLADFKVKAKQFSSIIEDITGCKRISSFNRNDWLAVAIGYKGHSDLVQTSKQRTLTDRSSQLVIFSKSHYFSSKIKSIFASQLSTTQVDIELAVTKMRQIEREELLLSGQLADDATLPIPSHLLRSITSALMNLPDSMIANIWHLALLTGLRLNELLSIRMVDVQTDRLLVENKQQSKAQTVHLTERAALLINQIKNDNPDSIFLFESGSKANSSPISASYVIKSFKNLSKEIGQRITVQNARATYIYSFQRKSAENLSMSGLAGHKCVNMTKHYVTKVKALAEQTRRVRTSK